MLEYYWRRYSQQVNLIAKVYSILKSPVTIPMSMDFRWLPIFRPSINDSPLSYATRLSDSPIDFPFNSP